jgi:CheY-like chemotaxis protein
MEVAEILNASHRVRRPRTSRPPRENRGSDPLGDTKRFYGPKCSSEILDAFSNRFIHGYEKRTRKADSFGVGSTEIKRDDRRLKNPKYGGMGMKGRKILVAEDEPHILKSLKLVLEEAGFSVVTAIDGEDALHKTREEKPDLLILDMTMPKMNGYEIYDKLRSDPLQRDIPVMMLTALGQVDKTPDGLGEHPFDIIPKPFNPYSVVDKVKEILKN